MRLFLLVLLVSCSSAPIRNVYYLVTTSETVYRCNEHYHTAYGASARDCLDLSTSEVVDLVPNPYSVKEVER